MTNPYRSIWDLCALPVPRPKPHVPGYCDFCHAVTGAWWIDHYWACAECVRQYLERLRVNG